MLASCHGPFGSHARLADHQVIRLPDALSFSEACAAAPFLTTAYHVLVELGCVGPGDCVLIHNGMSPIGQAALHILSGTGVTDVWTTAGGQDDCTWISRRFGLVEDNILPQAWFESSAMALCQVEAKFDVVLSSGFSSALPQPLSHVRSGGHFISLCDDTGLQHKFSNHFASRSVSVHMLQMSDIYGGETCPTRQALESSISLAKSMMKDNSKLRVNIFNASNVDGAFRNLRKAGKETSVVVVLNEPDTISVSRPLFRLPLKLISLLPLTLRRFVCRGKPRMLLAQMSHT